MSKATVNLMKRYVAILNITKGNSYKGSDEIQTLLSSEYGFVVARRVVQRDLNDLFSVHAVEKKGNAPISWRSGGINVWANTISGGKNNE